MGRGDFPDAVAAGGHAGQIDAVLVAVIFAEDIVENGEGPLGVEAVGGPLAVLAALRGDANEGGKPTALPEMDAELIGDLQHAVIAVLAVAVEKEDHRRLRRIGGSWRCEENITMLAPIRIFVDSLGEREIAGLRGILPRRRPPYPTANHCHSEQERQDDRDHREAGLSTISVRYHFRAYLKKIRPE